MRKSVIEFYKLKITWLFYSMYNLKIIKKNFYNVNLLFD